MFPALVLIPLIALFRIFLDWQPAGSFYTTVLPGACPLSAVALCAGLFLPRRLALVVPLGILLFSDVVIDLHRHESFFSAFLLGRYVLLALIGLGGMALRRQRGLATVLGAALAGSTLFYVASNALSWVGATAYPQTLAGLWQAFDRRHAGLPALVRFFPKRPCQRPALFYGVRRLCSPCPTLRKRGQNGHRARRRALIADVAGPCSGPLREGRCGSVGNRPDRTEPLTAGRTIPF